MYLLNEEPPELQELLQKEHEIAAPLFERIPIAQSGVKIPSESLVYDREVAPGGVLLIREGIVQCVYSGRVQCICEEGDVIGIERGITANQQEAFKTDFAVVVDRYELETILTTVAADPELFRMWTDYLLVRMGVLRVVAASFQREEVHFNPELLSFSEGDVLIDQGTVGDKVFTMAEGSADVFVDGVKVGEVLKDEMFGAIATLTDTPRTASVIATASCLVLALPKDKFIDLTKNRPSTVQQLVHNMARTIVDLNDQVVSLRS